MAAAPCGRQPECHEAVPDAGSSSLTRLTLQRIGAIIWHQMATVESGAQSIDRAAQILVRLMESDETVTLASVKPSGTASVTTTVPTGTETPAPQTGPRDPAGKVTLGMATAGEAVKVTVDPSSP